MIFRVTGVVYAFTRSAGAERHPRHQVHRVTDDVEARLRRHACARDTPEGRARGDGSHHDLDEARSIQPRGFRHCSATQPRRWARPCSGDVRLPDVSYDSIVFGSKKDVDPRGLAESWSVKQGTNEGKPMVVRINRGLDSAAGRSPYGIQIGVAVPLVEPDERGLPKSAESLQLNEIEDEIVSVAGDRAVLAAVITTSSMREFVLYAAQPEWIEGFHKDLKARITHHEVQVMAQQDKDWTTFKTLR